MWTIANQLIQYAVQNIVFLFSFIPSIQAQTHELRRKKAKWQYYSFEMFNKRPCDQSRLSLPDAVAVKMKLSHKTRRGDD